MIPELGHVALILALSMALIQGTVPLLGAARGVVGWMAVARPAAMGQMLFLTVAMACLAQGFLVNDFSVAYVANNSNTALPWYYRVTAIWGGHEGSMLLWVFILGGWQMAVAAYSRALPERFGARVLGVMGVVAVGFLLFTLLTSNPFDRMFPAAVEGRDLNPLLQDVGLIIHPPMLYMGYVGFSVAFSFAVAALLGGRLDAAWARWSRPWTTVAWVFLTAGIALGSWWAYYELGWGGWWFWDPVENASFMPWLVGTALIHSLAVTEKRGAMKSWTVLLAIFAFSLSLLGTFLVRSGVLTSVHAFATDPARGVFILALLLIVIGVSLALYAWRAPAIRGGGRFELFSRETALLTNNALLTAAAATVLLGTLYPLLLDSLGMGKISVGPPYFNAVFVPLTLPLVFLAGIGPLMRWKRQDARELANGLRVPALLVLAACVGVLIWTSGMPVLTIVGVAGAIWLAVTTLKELYDRVAHRERPLQALGRLPRSIWGMTVAHLGVAVFVAGVTVVSTYEVETDVRMAPGDTTEFGPYTIHFAELTAVQGPNYQASEGRMEISRDGEPVAVLRPQKRTYRVQTQPMTEAGIDAGFTRDLFVALGEPLEQSDAWAIRVQYKPMMRWVWGGCAIMALGGLLAAADRRYKRLLARDSTAEAAAAGRVSA